MGDEATTLAKVFEGWDTYQVSLVEAVKPLTREQLAWKPAHHLRSAGEIIHHISDGRIDWFNRMGAPGAASLFDRLESYASIVSIGEAAIKLIQWLELSWEMVENNLNRWTAGDLWETYRQPYQGVVYAVSRQWTIWRVMAHDLHHGGELAVTLGLQGISIPELGDLGGHLNMPPVSDP